MCGMTWSCVWHDSFICGTWLIETHHRRRCLVVGCVDPYVLCDSITCRLIGGTWLNHMCIVTRSFVCHDSIMLETWFSPTYGWIMSYIWLNHVAESWAICRTWLIQTPHRRHCLVIGHVNNFFFRVTWFFFVWCVFFSCDLPCRRTCQLIYMCVYTRYIECVWICLYVCVYRVYICLYIWMCIFETLVDMSSDMSIHCFFSVWRDGFFFRARVFFRVTCFCFVWRALSSDMSTHCFFFVWHAWEKGKGREGGGGGHKIF